LAGLIILKIVPIATALLLSLTNWDVVGSPSFIGLRNYQGIVTHAEFWVSLRNTAEIGIWVEALNITLGLCLALLLNKRLRGIGIFRAIYLVPLVTTWVAVALVWDYLYSQSGPIDDLLTAIHLSPISWLATPQWALPAMVITISWKNLAWNMLIYLAGLQAIPHDVYEASSIDGASPLRQFFQITLPLLTPAIFFSLVVGIIETFQIFDPVYVMTRGGPDNATRTIAYYIYSAAFGRLQMGYAAALSWVLFIIIMAFTLMQWLLQRRWVFYDS
jgi:multiple sugar transport system permease protein